MAATVTCPVCGAVGRAGEECQRCAEWTMLSYALGRPLSMPSDRTATRRGSPWYAWIPPTLGLLAAGWLAWEENLVAAGAAAAASILAMGWLLLRNRSPRGPR